MSLYKIPWREDFSIGTGISDFTGLPVLRPWAFEDADRAHLNRPQPDTAGNGNVSISKGIISETSHYQHALRASASVNVKLWGLVGVQASTKVLTELELNSQTSHYVVTGDFETETFNSLDKLEHLPTLSNSARDFRRSSWLNRS